MCNGCVFAVVDDWVQTGCYTHRLELFKDKVYVLARNTVGAGPDTAIKVGVLAWMICLPGVLALYAFYNAGTYVPIATGGGILVASIVGTLIAGSIYKD